MGVLMCPFPPKKLRSFTVLSSTGGADDRLINLLHFVIHNFKGGQSFQWNSREQKCDQNLYRRTFEVKTGHFGGSESTENEERLVYVEFPKHCTTARV